MNVAAAADDLNTQFFTKLVRDALRQRFANSKAAAKEIVEITGGGVRTAEHWLAGRHCPDVANFFKLAQELPELQAEVRRILGMQTDMDPEFAQALNAFISTYQRIAKVDQIALRAVDAAAAREARKKARQEGGGVGGAFGEVAEGGSE